MNAVSSWQELLKQPEVGNHIVQIYQDDGFLAEAVCHFIAAGLERNEAIIIIATAEHRQAFTSQLDSGDVVLQEAVRRGQIKFYDAKTMLSTFMSDGMPQWSIFQEVIGRVVRDAQLEYGTVRAYGEMVDVLWQKGERDAAMRLEEFWNDLSKEYQFSLLCAYYMDNLSPAAYEGGLQCICKYHTHMIPAKNYALLEAAVHEAGQDILGEALANMLRVVSAKELGSTSMPPAQASLLYLSENMPFVAAKILSQVKERYESEENRA